MTDARIVRTRAALHGAITELAAQKPVTDITVSELASHAGINRVTFYKHFTNPGEALGSALSLELNPAREQYLAHPASRTPEETFTASIDLVLDHVERHRRLYELAVATPQDGTVPNLLADHFTETLQQYLTRREHLEPPLPQVERLVIARFFAHGLVGALKAWLLNSTDDRDLFQRSILQLAPDWWFPKRD